MMITLVLDFHLMACFHLGGLKTGSENGLAICSGTRKEEMVGGKKGRREERCERGMEGERKRR